MRFSTAPFLAFAILLSFTSLTQAQSSAPDGITAQDTKPVVNPSPSFWSQDYLTGDWGGARSQLSSKGVSFGFNAIQEVLGNPSGGIHQGIIEEGRLEMALDIDFKALAGLDGSSFHVNSYYIYGSGLSGKDVGNLLTVSNIEAYNSLRLFDLWYQQQFLDGKVSLRIGQIASDDEFAISSYAANFVNSTFGWPALMGVNLPSGGPAYPLAAPGVRLIVNPIQQVSLMAAVFSGDPGEGFSIESAQKEDNSGTRIQFDDGIFAIYEAAYKWNQEDGSKGLPGTYKLGGWYGNQSYPDVNQGTTSGGSPKSYPGNWGIYFIADQMVWRKPPAVTDPKDAKSTPAATCANDQGLGLFWRVGGSPADRNTISFYTDGGLNYKGLIPGRDQDILGLGVAYAKISDDLSTFEQESNSTNGIDAPVQDYEIAIEATYIAQLAPWWTVQPDIQYIVHPGGNVADPTNASGTQAIPNAVVLGVRTTINF